MNDKIATCDNCNYDTDVEEYTHLGSTRKLCRICASTFFGRATENSRDMSSGEYYLLRSVPALFNALVDALDIREKFNNALYKEWHP